MLKRLALRLEPRKRRQQRGVNVQNAIRKRGDKIRRNQAHITRKANQIDTRRLQCRHNQLVIGLALQPFRRNRSRRNPARPRTLQPRRVFAIAQDKRNLGARNLPCRNALCQRLKVRSTPREQHTNFFRHNFSATEISTLLKGSQRHSQPAQFVWPCCPSEYTLRNTEMSDSRNKKIGRASCRERG